MKKQQGKKLDADFRQKVIAVYLGCLNYNKTARLCNIAPNSVKNIVARERKNNPKHFAKLCTNYYKRANKDLNDLLQRTQDAVFNSATLCYMDRPYFLNCFMHAQDKQLIERNKLIYEAKRQAITYEATRIKRALFLKDVKELTKLLKQAEKDNVLYEPLDLAFLGKEAHYGETDYNNHLSDKEEKAYIDAIKTYLIDLGYNLEEVNVEDFIASKDRTSNYYYDVF